MKIAEFSRSQLRHRHNERCPFKAPLMMDNDKSDENGDPTFPEQGRRADLFLKEGKLVRGVLEKGAMQIVKNPEELPALHRPSIHPETPPHACGCCVDSIEPKKAFAEGVPFLKELESSFDGDLERMYRHKLGCTKLSGAAYKCVMTPHHTPVAPTAAESAADPVSIDQSVSAYGWLPARHQAIKRKIKALEAEVSVHGENTKENERR